MSQPPDWSMAYRQRAEDFFHHAHGTAQDELERAAKAECHPQGVVAENSALVLSGVVCGCSKPRESGAGRALSTAIRHVAPPRTRTLLARLPVARATF
jgi:hypothetical protein